MRVLLRSDIDGVGRRGDIVDVSGGFARNYLVPTGRAVEAPDGITQQAAATRRSRDLREAKDRESAETVSGVITAKPLVVSARGGARAGCSARSRLPTLPTRSRPRPERRLTAAGSPSPSRSGRSAPIR